MGLRQIKDANYRNILTKIALPSRKLDIELGRHNNVPINVRKFTLCNQNDIEGEFHFIPKSLLYYNLIHCKILLFSHKCYQIHFIDTD